MSKLVFESKVNDQKKFYKNGKKSLCHSCFNYNLDCSVTMKVCEKDDKTVYSYVKKCSHLNKEIAVIEYTGTSIAVSEAAESRIDMMGGGFQNIDKYKD